MRGQAYDFTFNAGLFVGSRERGPYVTFPRNICERHLFPRSWPKLRTLVDSLTPRADWITIRVSTARTSHLFQLASTPTRNAHERVPTTWLRSGHEFLWNNIHGMEMFLQWEIRSSKDGIGGIQLNGSMCYVIVTGRSLLWTLLSLVALMAVLSGLITPKWLIGPQMKDTSNYFLFYS